MPSSNNDIFMSLPWPAFETAQGTHILLGHAGDPVTEQTHIELELKHDWLSIGDHRNGGIEWNQTIFSLPSFSFRSMQTEM